MIKEILYVLEDQENEFKPDIIKKIKFLIEISANINYVNEKGESYKSLINEYIPIIDNDGQYIFK